MKIVFLLLAVAAFMMALTGAALAASHGGDDDSASAIHEYCRFRWTSDSSGGNAVKVYPDESEVLDNSSVQCHYHWTSPQGVIVTTMTATYNAKGQFRGWRFTDYFPAAESSTPALLAAGDVTSNSATLTLNMAGHSGDWHYQYTVPAGGTCSAAVSGTTATVNALNANTSYTFTAYSDANCQTELASATFTTATAAGGSGQPALTHSNVGHSSATLTLSNHSGDWWHKQTSPAGGTCSANAVSSANAYVTGLSASTGYTFAAYGDGDCSTDMKLAETSFTTSEAPGPGGRYWRTPISATTRLR